MNISVVTKSFLCVAVVAVAFTSVAKATPYASGVSESVGTVSFVLNEDSDSVIISRTGDSDLILGALSKGTQSFPLGAASAYSIEVSKTAAATWTQISSDTQAESRYYSPRGVSVNKNPASEYFGRIYVSEAIGNPLGAPFPERGAETLPGIYSMTADQFDVLGQNDDSAFGGIDWDVGGSNSPFHVTVAPDDTLYIADWSDGHSGVWRAPADLDESSDWPNVLADDNPAGGGLFDNHGSIPGVWVEGTGASTKMYTVDEDFPNRGDILRYDIGTATNYAGAPTAQVSDDTNVILNGLMDVVRDEDGSWWMAQYRFTDTQAVPALTHWADGGTEPLYASGLADGLKDADFDDDTLVTGSDLLAWQRNFPDDVCCTPHANGDANFDGNIDDDDRVIWEEQFGTSLETLNLDLAYGSIDIHDDLDLLVMGARSGGGVFILDISNPGAPVLLNTIEQTGYSNDVSFDIAGNVYVVSRSSETLRIWSPGGSTVATTGSDGSFSLVQPAISAPVVIPEPTSLAMGLLGLMGLACSRRRSRS